MRAALDNLGSNYLYLKAINGRGHRRLSSEIRASLASVSVLAAKLSSALVSLEADAKAVLFQGGGGPTMPFMDGQRLLDGYRAKIDHLRGWLEARQSEDALPFDPPGSNADATNYLVSGLAHIYRTECDRDFNGKGKSKQLAGDLFHLVDPGAGPGSLRGAIARALPTLQN